MKSILCSLLGAIALTGTLQAGNVLVTNFEETSGRQMPISVGNGVGVSIGGVIQIGSFASGDPSALIAGLTSPAGLAALLADFINFGASNTIGSDFSGLYASDKSSPLLAGNPLVGKPIYTLIGNSHTLAGSTDLGIVRHPDAFAADAPVFSALADLSDPAVVVLRGWRGPGFVTALGPSTESLNISFPEPSVALLLAASLAAVAGRRKRDQSCRA